MNALSQELTWGVAIATYKRADALVVTIRLAMDQTRPPSEIVIVDASEDWIHTQTQLEPLFEECEKLGVRSVFEHSRHLSTAVQRNRCLELSHADIVFLIDDDSWMFSDCAEQIMRVYEVDSEAKVMSVAAFPNAEPPPTIASESAQQAEAERAAPNATTYARPLRWVRDLLRADELFIPYNSSSPEPRVPEELHGHNLGARLTTPGMTMTVRREDACRVRFCDLLVGPSYGEDDDFTYRLSQRGALVTAFQAKLYHAGSPSGRAHGFSSSALKAMNQVVLHRLYSTNLSASRRRLRGMLVRRVVIEGLKDLRASSLRFPRASGYAFALVKLSKILSMELEQLNAWYPDYQRGLLGWSSPGGTPTDPSTSSST